MTDTLVGGGFSTNHRPRPRGLWEGDVGGGMAVAEGAGSPGTQLRGQSSTQKLRRSYNGPRDGSSFSLGEIPRASLGGTELLMHF